MDRLVYADNAATTQVSTSVVDAMMPYITDYYGNPSSLYSVSRPSVLAITKSRQQVAAALGCDASEIFFTSCGTESDNWAIKGAARKLKARGKNHLITTNIEHHAVLHTCQHLEREGFEVTFLPVNTDGLITAEQVQEALRPETALVTVMYANNEIGTIQPIAEIGAVCKNAGVWFHTDAVQAIGNINVHVREQNIDLLSLSGHKIYAPKGIGALYVRKGIVLDTFMDGGAQESSRRAGTENVAFIVALGQAIEDVCSDLDQHAALQRKLRDSVIKSALTIPRVRLNGSLEHRLPGNVNLSIEGIEGEALLLRLDLAGIQASSGSACTSGSLDPSHVLLALGLPHEIAHGSLRITFGRYNTGDDAHYIIEKLPGVVQTLRDTSPVWGRINNQQ